MTKTITKIDLDEQQLIAKKTRVAAYCRVSTSSAEQLISLDAQRAHYEQYIRSNPEWEFVGVYYDEGISGTKKKDRFGLLNLIRDSEIGKIDLILTKSISRFSRSTTDCLDMVRKLMNLGVRVLFEKENIDTGSMESELMLSILSSLAEDESHSISQNIRWSVQKKFQDGTYQTSVPAYGYRNKDGKMVLIPEQAEVIKRIFEDSVNGKSTCQIAKELNTENTPTQRGGKWHSTTVNSIIRNETYTGDALFQKTYTDDNFNRHSNTGEKNMYIVENHHEAIVSKEIFELANRELERRAAEKGHEAGNDSYGNRYSFSGKIYCKECGSKLKRMKHAMPEPGIILWSCKGHLADKTACSLKAIKDEELKTAFITMLNKLRFAKDQILYPLLKSLQGFDSQENLIRIDEITERLEKNLEQQQTLAGLVSDGIIEPALMTKLRNELLQEQTKLEKQKVELSESMVGNRSQIDELKKLISYLTSSNTLEEFSDDLFDTFGEKIIAISRSEVEFELKCGLKLKEGL